MVEQDAKTAVNSEVADSADRHLLLTRREERFLRMWREFWWVRGEVDLRGSSETLGRLAREVLGESAPAERWRRVRDRAEDRSPRRVPGYTPRSAERIAAGLPGLVLGAAVGDAIGLSSGSGESGAGEYGEVSAATQLELFMLEGLVNGRVHHRRHGWHDCDPLHMFTLVSYLMWMYAQGYEWRDLFGSGFHASAGWLARRSEIRFRRNPDEQAEERFRRFISERKPALDARPESRSCGPLALAPPLAIWCDDIEELVQLAVRNTALTHGPVVRAAAAALAVLCNRLLNEESPREAVDSAIAAVGALEGAADVVRALRIAVDLPADPRQAFPDAHSADQALGVAVRAVLANPGDFAGGVRAAAQSHGDRPAIAAMCGAMLGGVGGIPSIPDPWLAGLRVRGLAEELIADAVVEFTSEDAPETAEWFARYDYAGEA